MLETKKQVLPVDVSADISAPEIMGWDGEKYIKAIGTKEDSFNGDGSTKTFTLTYDDVIHGTVIVTVDGSEKTEGTDYTVDYAAGKITFDSAPDTGTGNIVVNYSYFAAEPSAILDEDVTQSQSPAYALMVVHGIYYEDEFSAAPNADVKARLRLHSVFVEPRASA